MPQANSHDDPVVHQPVRDQPQGHVDPVGHRDSPSSLRQGASSSRANFQSFNMWLIIGVMYFIIIMALTKLSNRLEKRINK